MFVPIYTSDDAARWGYAFRRQQPGQEPACWAWAPDGSEIMTDTEGVEMIHEPGRLSPRFAHELYFETENRETLPIRLDPPGESPGGTAVA